GRPNGRLPLCPSLLLGFGQVFFSVEYQELDRSCPAAHLGHPLSARVFWGILRALRPAAGPPANCAKFSLTPWGSRPAPHQPPPPAQTSRRYDTEHTATASCPCQAAAPMPR